MKSALFRFVCCFAASLALNVPAVPQQNPPQQISKFDRDRATDMLQVIAADVRKRYYDPKFHGLDWDARVEEAKQKIAEAPSMNMALSRIAGALDALNDSHTFFLPPPRPYRHDYGFRLQMIGDKCFVIRVRPQRDAESKGLKPGDEVLSVNGFHPTREDFWRMQYVFNLLRPQPTIRLELHSPSSSPRPLEIAAKMREESHVKELRDNIWNLVRESDDSYYLSRPHIVEMGALMILRLPVFYFSETEVQSMMGKARKRKALIIDLRSNPGGAVDSLKCLLATI